MVVRIAFRECHPAVDDDRAVPVPRAGAQHCDELPARRPVDAQPGAARVVDPEQAAGDNRARPAVPHSPDGMEPPLRERPRLRRAAIGREHPDALPTPPHRGRREEIRAGRGRDDLELVARVRRRAAQPREREEPDLSVLAALRDQVRREIDG